MTFCLAHGIEYRVLTRRPKAGLPPRTSTNLRGFLADALSAGVVG